MVSKLGFWIGLYLGVISWVYLFAISSIVETLYPHLPFHVNPVWGLAVTPLTYLFGVMSYYEYADEYEDFVEHLG